MLTTEFNPAVSPDGKWLAYIARDTGGKQLYVRDFPAGKSKHRISNDGADGTVWSIDGRNLYFKNGDRIMAASIHTQPTFAASSPRTAAEIPGLIAFDVDQDGRFLVIRRTSPPPVPQLVVIPDWRALLPSNKR